MGYFSWLTADTQESIACVASGRKIKTVYLLQPNGAAPIAEPAYEGFGVFGGVDAYEWLARQNVAQSIIDALSDDEIRCVGLNLDCGTHLFVDKRTNERVSIFHPVPAVFSARFFPVRFDEPLDAYAGATANELIEQGRLEPTTLVDVRYPLKFSFREGAVYEDLTASKSDPAQGFFYGEAE